MLDIELSNLIHPHRNQRTQNVRERKKKATGRQCSGEEKNDTGFCLREEKKNSSHSSSSKNRWEPSESLKLVSSAEQMKLVDLVSFLLLGWLFQGLGLRLSDSSSSCWPPIDLPPANCPL